MIKSKPKRAKHRTPAMTAKQGTRQKKLRGGLWVRSLCGDCNNRVCGPYAKEYVKFVKDLVDAPTILSGDARGRWFTVRADTLLIAKEIATMILAIHGADQAVAWPELRKFVLDPAAVLQMRFKISAFLVPDVPEAGTVTRFHARADTFAKGYKFSGGEISMYPFGFIFSSDVGVGYQPDLMTDITHWFTESGSMRHSMTARLHSRTTGVDAIQTGLGHPRTKPQIDFVGSDFMDG